MSEMAEIVVIGGGGHARVLIDLIRRLNEYDVVGIVDARLDAGVVVNGIAVLGTDAILPDLIAQGVRSVCVGVGSIRENSVRRHIYEMASELGFSVPVLAHPSAIVSGSVRLDPGAQIMAGVILQAGAVVGKNTIINTGALVDHDCIVGPHVHICPGVVVSGGCVIGEGAFIGTGAVVIQGIRIGVASTVAAGAVVIEDVPDGALVKGIPAE